MDPGRRALAGLAVAVALLVPVRPAAQAPPGPDDLARLIQAHYASVNSFTAAFTYSYASGVLPQTTTERGVVKIRKPGRMRWTYQSPEVKEFVADGRMLYSVVKADRVCYVSDLPQGDTVSTAVLFLAGRGDLVRDFRPAAASEPVAGEWRLDLTPVTPQAEFTRLTLGVDPATLALRTMATVDPEGGRATFRFTSLKENPRLADPEFLFTCPKGFDVIR